MLIPILIVLVIILIVAGIAGARKNGEGSGEDMVKNVYIYLVLFATLMMTIGGSVSVFMAAADIIAPTPYYQSFEDFQRWSKEKPYGVEEAEFKQATDEELRTRYDALVQSEKERQMARAKNTLIKSFGWIVIPLPVFIYFQRRLAANKEQLAQ